jgi:hypothetical protein
MPKISYTPKAKEGFDDAGVTALQIEQKIAEIQTLLRGMIDEDNLLAYNEDATAVNLPPSNVVDMPVETRPVQQCMKFFGITTNHDVGIVETLFDEAVQAMENSPSFAILNGIGDKEIVIASEGAERGSVKRKSVIIEIPSFYVPLTWGELWDYVSVENKNIGVKINPAKQTAFDRYIAFELTTKDEFLSEFGVLDSDHVIETSYNLSETHTFEYYVNVSTVTNSIFVEAMVYPKTEGWVYRVATSILCRVNP